MFKHSDGVRDQGRVYDIHIVRVVEYLGYYAACLTHVFISFLYMNAVLFLSSSNFHVLNLLATS